MADVGEITNRFAGEMVPSLLSPRDVNGSAGSQGLGEGAHYSLQRTCVGYGAVARYPGDEAAVLYQNGRPGAEALARRETLRCHKLPQA